MQLEVRTNTPFWLVLFAPLFAMIVALSLCSVLIIWADAPVFTAYGALLNGGLGSRFAIMETLSRSIPLIFTGLAVAVAFRSKFYNIGCEGQLYCGALAAVYIGSGMITLPPIAMIPLLMLCGVIAGGLLLIVPVLLKTHLKVDEVVTTLLLNFIVLLMVSYLIEGPMKDPASLGWPQTASIIDEGVFPPLFEKSRVHLGLIFALIAAVITWIVMRFTTFGYASRAVGLNLQASNFFGIPVNMTIIKVSLISGGLAGLAGVSEVAGLKGYLTLDLSPGFGYTGIVVAMLAQLNPIGVVISAFFISVVYVGADSMSRVLNIPAYLADVIVGVSVLCVLVSVMFTQYRLRFK
jgi:simple sugar transport system permease protein